MEILRGDINSLKSVRLPKPNLSIFASTCTETDIKRNILSEDILSTLQLKGLKAGV